MAGPTGITADYLYQIERGMKLPTFTVLARLAEVLGVSVAELLDQEPAASGRTSPTAAGDALYRALTSPVSATSEPPSVAEVHTRVARAWRTWQTSPQRYSQLAGQLPQLIIDMESAVQVHQADTATSFRYAKGCAVDLYSLVRTVTERIGRCDLSLLAADRAVRAAEAADDAPRLGLARWNLAHVLLADDLSEDAELVAMRGADALRPLMAEGGAETAAVYGALLLLGAAAVARQGDTWTAHSRLREAAPLADRTGECNTLWTAFGPTNVAMYAVTVEIEAGEVVEGIRLAEQIDHRCSPSIERRVAFLLDQAKGYEQRRDYATALLLLHTAEREAPEDIQHRPDAHAILRTVVKCGRRTVAADATQLATRVGLSLNWADRPHRVRVGQS